jgi:hypothetical protein
MRTNRRQFVRTVGAGAAGLTLGSPSAARAAASQNAAKPIAPQDGPVLLVGDKIAVVENLLSKCDKLIIGGGIAGLCTLRGSDVQTPFDRYPPEIQICLSSPYHMFYNIRIFDAMK